MLRKAVESKILYYLQAVLMLLSLAQLVHAEAYYINYVALFLLAFIGCWKNKELEQIPLHKKGHTAVFSVLFTLMIVLGNYDMRMKPLLRVLFILGVFCAMWNLFYLLLRQCTSMGWAKEEHNKAKPKRVFWICFGILVVPRLFVLYLSQYPGELTFDSFTQIEQVLVGKYTNVHPFYHTQLIRFFLWLGVKLAGNLNAGAALYSAFQILFICACFAMTISTMARLGVPKWIRVIVFLFYLLMPYHILYSMTMWKDVMFGGFVLLLILYVVRCIRKLGNQKCNNVMLGVSALGVCLFRSNGFFAFVLFVVCFALIWKKQYIKMMIEFALVILVAFVLKHPVLNALEVSQPVIVESLSIPIQQIARVVSEGYDLTEFERTNLDRLLDVNLIPERYDPYLSDSMKGLVSERGKLEELEGDKWTFAKVYLSIGLRHPIVYTRGWIDQTKGYWNSGYEYWIWSTDVTENPYGIDRIVRSEGVDGLVESYLRWFSGTAVLKVFMSVGVTTWVVLFVLFVSIVRKEKLGATIAIPIIALVMSLLIATPVFCEFRYCYASFCALPFILAVCFEKRDMLDAT